MVSLRSEILLDSKLIMRDGLLRTNPLAVVDNRGYVRQWRSNLLPGIDTAITASVLETVKGGEPDTNFCAAHSSSALAANVFGPFLDGKIPLPIPGIGEIELTGFARRSFTKVWGRSSCERDGCPSTISDPVIIMSKGLEYLTQRSAAAASINQFSDQLLQTPWYSEMERLKLSPHTYEALNVPELIKLASGIIDSYGEGGVLAYLFWEPDDAALHAPFRRHRDELVSFTSLVAESPVKLVALSYPDLWNSWKLSASAMVRDRAVLLRTRYCGRLGSYEGYTRVDGRKTDDGFFDDLD